MKYIPNKRGDKVISVYWFAILIIVAGAIFAMVYIFYGTPYDIRETESDLLINQIANCISYGGRINTDIISNGEGIDKTGKEFLEECHLIFNSSEWKDEQYYIKVDFYKPEDLENTLLEIDAGDNRWVTSCALQENKEEERLSKCNEKKFYSLDDVNNQYIIKILAVVRKTEKNVQL